MKKSRIFFCIILTSFLLFLAFFLTHHGSHVTINFADATLVSRQSLDQIAEFEKWNCGKNKEINSNFYVKEIQIPEICSIPISIAFDEKDNKVWFIGTRNGTLFEYSPSNQTFKSYQIPVWFSRDYPIGNSWSWDLKLDKSGNNIWFTDEKLNSIWRFDKNDKKFEQFVIPFYSNIYSTAYPVSIEFVDDKNLYFIGIRSLSLWHGNIEKMANGTSAGIEEIPISLNGLFKGIPKYEIGLGSLAIDQAKKNIWITALAFEKKGVLIKYDIYSKNFSLYELPSNFRSPTGITMDSNDTIWITDHATSSFYKINSTMESSKLDPSDMERIVTSPLSSRIYGVEFSDISNKSLHLYENSLPYWIKSTNDGTIVTNEHVGNKIARYFPDNETMIEYWLPSQNIIYSACNPNNPNLECGYSNALQFDVESKMPHDSENYSSRIWFTEQSENKIGYVDLEKAIPISLTVDPSFLNISGENNNETAQIDIQVNIKRLKNNDLTVQSYFANEGNMILKPVISGTLTPNGDINGLETTIKPEILHINLDQNTTNSDVKTVSFSISLKPDSLITPGNYNLMIGVESHDFTIMQKVKLKVSN